MLKPLFFLSIIICPLGISIGEYWVPQKYKFAFIFTAAWILGSAFGYAVAKM